MTEIERARAREIARAFDQQLSLSEQSREWAAHTYTPADGGRPALQIDDVSAIPFLVDVVGVELYQLRSRIRARAGDVFVATCPELPDYEAYNTERLGLGDPAFVYAAPVGDPIAVAEACRHGEAFEALAAFARSTGGMLMHPYMGTLPAWKLARDLAAASGVRVAVLGPPPRITWFANDKIELTELVQEVLDPELVVPSHVAVRPDELADALLGLAKGRRKVALKMARCASAMGNRVYSAEDLLAAGWTGAHDEVARFLKDKQWTEGEAVLAVVWEQADASPSSQLWIPPLGHGDPVVDGIYEQLLEGPEQVFLGSVPSRLGEEIDRYMGEASVALATVYQELGYVGRCSFDFILVGGELRITECNGRWGGTSTPMHLLDRLFPSGRPAYRARDYVSEHLVGMPFARLADALGDALYDARTGRGHFILYNVGCLAYGKFDVIALGEDVEHATERLETELPRLLGA